MSLHKLVSLAKSLLGRFLNRDIVFLPRMEKGRPFGPGAGAALLAVAYTYRASADGMVTYRFPGPGRFDVFWAWDVLEHSTDPERMLSKLTAQAAPGSWLFIYTSHAESLTHALFKAIGRVMPIIRTMGSGRWPPLPCPFG